MNKDMSDHHRTLYVPNLSNFFFLFGQDLYILRKIQHLNRHSKKNYAPCSRAFISYTASTPTNNGAENLKNGFLLFRLVAFIVHALIEKCLSTKVKGNKKVGSTYFRSGNQNPDDGNCPCSQHLKLSVTDRNTGSNIVSGITSLPINLSSDDGEANTCIFNV